MNEKQQEFLRLCHQPYVEQIEFSMFFNENRQNIPLNCAFMNKCLLACCQNENYTEMYWIYYAYHTGLTIPPRYLNDEIDHQMYSYMMELCCAIGNDFYLKRIRQQIFWPEKLLIPTIRRCYNLAFTNKQYHILFILAIYYPNYVHVYSNFNYKFDYYFSATHEDIQTIEKKEKRKKQLFLLWISSNHSPNKNCLLHQLPNEISRYIIEQLVD